MNKFACTILPVLLLSSPSLSPKAFLTSFTPQPVQAAQTKSYIKGWNVYVSNVAYPGQTYQGQYSHQASNNWIAVTVTCQNTTGKRKWSNESPMNSTLAQLIDTSGQKHSVRDKEIKYEFNRISSPYEVNESRTEVWLFDVPRGTQASQLILNLFDENGTRLML